MLGARSGFGFRNGCLEQEADTGSKELTLTRKDEAE